MTVTFPGVVLILCGRIGAWLSSRLRSAIKAPSGYPMWSYWLAWALFTPLFFTFSANILWTYLLPSIAAFSILASMIIQTLSDDPTKIERRLMPIAAIVPIVVLGLSVAIMIKPDLGNTERGLVRRSEEHTSELQSLMRISNAVF